MGISLDGAGRRGLGGTGGGTSREE